MQKVKCPSCQKTFLVDTEQMMNLGETIVLRGNGKTEPLSTIDAPDEKVVRLNVICPHCDKEFLIKPEVSHAI